MQQPHLLDKNDEIDLVALLGVLWKNKIKIALMTLVFTAIAAAYAFTAKEQWTSKAVVIGPELTQMEAYLDVNREYNRILRTEQLDPIALSNTLFSNFNRLSESIDTRREFFLQSAIYKQLSADKNEVEKRHILSGLTAESIKIVAPDPKKEPNAIGRTISFSAETPEEAQETLSAFIEFINNQAFRQVSDNFLVDFKNTLSSLKYEKSLIQEDLTVNRSIQLENLTKAYETAIKAGIKEYSKVFNDDNTASMVAAVSDTKIPLSDSKLADSSYLFMLGEKYLKAQIDVANEKNIIFPPRYYQIDFQIKQLEPLLERTKQVETKTYQYQASPDYPVTRDWPKRLIILLIGAALGGMIGCVVVIIRNVLIPRH